MQSFAALMLLGRWLVATPIWAADASKLRVLFLGDQGLSAVDWIVARGPLSQ